MNIKILKKIDIQRLCDLRTHRNTIRPIQIAKIIQKQQPLHAQTTTHPDDLV